MTPQASFLIVAPVAAQREAALRALLDSMNAAPGRADPQNALVPFGQFDTLHFARFLLLEDRTSGDVAAYGITPRTYPLCLAFLGDLDGDPQALLAELARRAGDGLRAIFSCCEEFSRDVDLARWMRDRNVRAATSYVNWIGRTVRQVREEAALRDAIETYLDRHADALRALSPAAVHSDLRRFVTAETNAGRLVLTPPAATPVGWRIRNALHLVGVPLLLLILSPLLVIAGAVLLIRIRMLEAGDAELCARVDRAYAQKLAALEDHDVSNAFSAMGSLKPGRVRRWTASFVLWAVDYTTRHLYARGRLARVQTIHFARWVMLNDRARLLFCSNYDGSLEGYMDDFINKVGFGLNLVFSNGVGYPRTRWLVAGGAKDEQKFKAFLRRHQMPTQVWYDAHSGLTAYDLARSARIRAGLERPSMSEEEARAWIALL